MRLCAVVAALINYIKVLVGVVVVGVEVGVAVVIKVN